MTQMEQIQPCVALFKWGLCRSRCASRSHEADNSSRLLLMSFRVRDRTRYRSQPRPARRCTFRLDAGTRSSLPPSATNRHCRCRGPLPPAFERRPIAAKRPPPAKEPPGYSIPQSPQQIGWVLLWRQMWEKPPSVTIPLGAARWYEATGNCASLPRSGRGYLHCGSDVCRIFALNGDGHRVRRHLEAEELG